jgi:hypothetical protein
MTWEKGAPVARYFDLSWALGTLLLTALAAVPFFAVWAYRKVKQARCETDAVRREAEEQLQSVKAELEKVKALESLRNVIKLDVSTARELLPEINIALNRTAFFIKNELSKKDTMKEVEQALLGFRQLMEILTALEKV